MGCCLVGCRAYVWIAEQAMNAEVPKDWVLLTAPDGTPYYYNDARQESRWTHPMEDHFKQLYHSMKVRITPPPPCAAAPHAAAG